MAIELQAKLVKPVSISALRDSMAILSARAFSAVAAPEFTGDGGVLGEQGFSVAIRLGEAEVEVESYLAPWPKGVIEEYAGWWAIVNVLVRSPESLALLLLTAVCVAQLAETDILDDSEMFGLGRWIPPEVGKSLLLADAPRPLRTAGLAVRRPSGSPC